MKKIIFRLSVLIISLIFISSCTDNDMKYTAIVPGTGEFQLSANKDSVIMLEAGGGTRTAIVFKWDSLIYKVSTPVTYTIQIDTLKGNFASPLEEVVATNKYEISYSDSILNNKSLNLLKLKPDVQNIVQVRIKANMAFGNMPVYSNVKTLKIKPFTPAKKVSFLYIPNLSTKLASRNNDGIYEGYVEATQWANFKFTEKADGSGTNYGSSATLGLYTLDATSAQWNIWFDAGGYFLLNANLNTMTWSKTPITSFCVTGDFNGWSLTANPMTYNSTTKVWTATCDITTLGWGLQIIANGDWAKKYGDVSGGKNDGELAAGGANLMPTVTGTRTVTIDLSNPEKYTYSIK